MNERVRTGDQGMCGNSCQDRPRCPAGPDGDVLDHPHIYSKSEDALDRYFNAFESGRMSESACGPRIEALGERVRALRARHAELTAAMEEEQLTGPSPEELDAFRAMIRDAIEDGPCCAPQGCPARTGG